MSNSGDTVDEKKVGSLSSVVTFRKRRESAKKINKQVVQNERLPRLPKGKKKRLVTKRNHVSSLQHATASASSFVEAPIPSIQNGNQIVFRGNKQSPKERKG